MDKANLDTKLMDGIKRFEAKKKQLTSAGAMYFLATTMSLLVGIAFGLLSFGFSVKIFTNETFWVMFTVTNFLSWTIIYTVSLRNIDIGIANSFEYHQLKSQYNEHIIGKIGTDFDSFLVSKNNERKKKAFKVFIENRLAKLERKAKDKDVDLYNSSDAKLKKKNKFCRLKKTYLDKLDKQYIDKNIHKEVVKYEKLTRSQLMGGSSSNEFWTPTIKSKQIASDNKGKFAFGFTVLMLFNMLIPAFLGLSVRTVLEAVVRLTLLSYHLYSSRVYGLAYCDTYEIPDMMEKIHIMKQYKEWKTQKKESN